LVYRLQSLIRMKNLLGLALAFTFTVACGAQAPEQQQQAVSAASELARDRVHPQTKGPLASETTHVEIAGSHCGNGILERGEECDDGYYVNNAASTESCSLEPTPPSDPDPTPIPEPSCGNGILETGEQCDDGNNECGDGCDHACNLEGLSQL